MCQGRLLCFMAEPGVWFFQVRLSKPSKRTRSSVPNGSPTVFFWRRNWLGLAGAAPCTLPCSIGFVLQVNVIASIVTSIGERSNAGSLLGPSFAGPWSKGPPLTARLPSSLRLGPQRQALPRFLQAPPVILRGCCLRTCNKTASPLNSQAISPFLFNCCAAAATTSWLTDPPIIPRSSLSNPGSLCTENIPPEACLETSITPFPRHRLSLLPTAETPFCFPLPHPIISDSTPHCALSNCRWT